MATKAGVWIDHKQATVVLISDAGREVKKIVFDIGQPVYTKGGGRSKNTFTRNDFVAEDKLERKVEAIEEVPPEQKPTGDNVDWIPGYWAWDDERTDFLWVSGIWRSLPPGRQWVSGYWAKSGRDSQ